MYQHSKTKVNAVVSIPMSKGAFARGGEKQL